MSKEYFSFKWDNFEKCLYRSITNEIIDRAKYADVTLVCHDKVSKEAHKLILSRSPQLRNFVLVNPHHHPLIFLTGIHHAEMEAILNIEHHVPGGGHGQEEQPSGILGCCACFTN